MIATELMQDFLDGDEPMRSFLLKARDNRKIFGPILVDLVTRLGHQTMREFDEREVVALLPIIFLLAEWREPYAYRPVVHLLRRPTQIVEELLGDHATESSFRIVASLFDGDLTPMIEGAYDPRADEYVRGNFMSALVLTTLAHPEQRKAVEQFFRDFLLTCPDAPDEVMISWVNSIAELGMEDMYDAVRDAMRKELIPSYHTNFENFAASLRETINGNGVPVGGRYRRFLISDAVGELCD